MSLSDVVAVLMFVGVVAYALFGGADFGSGVWDLLAGGDEAGGALRAQIDRSLGPVWEANHVWLIYILVFMWTAFPTAFSALMTTLFVPWLLVGFGIVLRGATFAFRKFSATLGEARLYGVVFASSSLITPFFLGMIAGAVASGRVPAEGYGDRWTSWTGPTSWLGGTLAVLTCTFLAGNVPGGRFRPCRPRRTGRDDGPAGARRRCDHRRRRTRRGPGARARRRVARRPAPGSRRGADRGVGASPVCSACGDCAPGDTPGHASAQ